MPRHAIVITFDHWHLGYLGCYGNDWVETPHLDQLAVNGVAFDHCYGENFDPDAVNHAWWTGRYQFPLSDEEQSRQKTIADALRDAGVVTRLIIESDGGEGSIPVFDEIHSLPLHDPVEQVSDTEAPFAQLVQRALRVLEEQASVDDRPSVWWLKARGIVPPWIPPTDYADLYYSEFGLDEAAAEVDLHAEDAAYDPALLARETAVAAEDITDLQYTRAFYAACATHRDRWLGKFLDEIQKRFPKDKTLILVTAGTGDSLGEHAAPGEEVSGLYEEVIHVPLLVHAPGLADDQAGTRRPAIVQSVDVAPTICDWLGVSAERLSAQGQSLLPLIRNESTSIRDAAWVSSVDGQQGVRTAQHYYLEAPAPEGDEFAEAPQHLFHKPFDRWDLADLARQSPGIVEELNQLLKQGPPSAQT